MVVYFYALVLVFFVIILGSGELDAKNSKLARHKALSYDAYVATKTCRTVPGLSKAQLELCYRLPNATVFALQGLNQAVKECQHQFQGHRWNCSSLQTRGRNPYINSMLQRGYREAAFAHAITSAGITISISRACSSGQLNNCGCDSKTYKMKETLSSANSLSKTDWKWGGCSHNLHYGMKFSKMFLDSREWSEDIQSKINLHNNKVGRMAVSNNMQLKCTCHGVSGSCELKTCWRASPDFRVIGNTLKEKFQTAIMVDQTNLGKKKLRKFNMVKQRKRKNKNKPKQWTPRKNKHKRDLSHDLLYYEKSPSFCESDPFLDVPGTTGRSCNRSSTGPDDSCANLCCGRGYNLVKMRRVESCRCKFVWCCRVDCETCSYEEWISVCK
ncbi:unnamed protein product [Phaedon cochleariae]|uniref:Protein Wnt n=1 Tax=Phaedon cochleariae TaxID=80249 RepID=A0A9P0DTF5_PHACE|nr:unnamed protein product [Phaedon cochleariae]